MGEKSKSSEYFDADQPWLCLFATLMYAGAHSPEQDNLGTTYVRAHMARATGGRSGQ